MTEAPLAEEPASVKLYPNQVYAVDNVLRAFDEGRKVVAIASPTGSGKSLLASEIARRSGLRAWVTSPQVSLSFQYRADPRVRWIQPEVQVLVGRSNYDCERDARAKARSNQPIMTAADATCYELTENGGVAKDIDSGKPVSCRYKRWQEGILPTCDYYREKALAELSPFVVTTLAFHTVAVSRYDSNHPEPKVGWNFGRLTGRPLLIVDEAHGLDKEVIRFLSQRWSDGSYSNGLYEKAWTEWTQTMEAQAIWDKPGTDEQNAEAIDALVDCLKMLGDPDASTDPAEVKFLEEIEADRDKLAGMARDIRAGIPIICHFQPGKVRRRDVAVLELTPVVAAPYLKRLLWDKAEKIVVMSGSFLDAKEDLRLMGLDHLPARLVNIPSEFPPENGPTIRIPVARFTAQTKDTALPTILKALWAILRLEPGRGIIHTQSFPNVDAIARNAPLDIRDRLVLHQKDSGISREDIIAEFQRQSRPGEVLASPSVTEGLDLPGKDQFAVFIKCPWADATNEQVARRMKLPDGQVWYQRQALVTTIQGRGRILRSKTDTGRCFLLDESHTDLLSRFWFKLPPHILDSLKAGDKYLAAHPELSRAVRDAVRPPAPTPSSESNPFEGIDFNALRRSPPTEP